MSRSLSVSSLGFRYPGGQGFWNVSFTASTGQVVCIFGRNGSGKTTLFRVLSTLIAPHTGEFLVCGINASQDKASARRKIFPVFDSNAHFDHLTGRENIALFMELYGNGVQESVETTAGLFDLDLDRKVREYSRGMKRKLYLAESLLSKREILLFDEPSLGLDSSMRSTFFRQAGDAARQGSCVIIFTNRIEDTAYADCLLKIEKGTLTRAASVDDLLEGMITVTISCADHEITEYISSAGELPDVIRKILPLGIPRKIRISAGDERELWSPEARQKVGRAPAVLRTMITRLVERHARESGYTRITEDVVEEVQRRLERR